MARERLQRGDVVGDFATVCCKVSQPLLRLLRCASPVVRVVLGSPAHDLLGSRLLVLEYRGRRSGRSFRIPLRYAEGSDGSLVAIAVRPERKLWWRSFAAPRPATLTLRGRTVEVRGALAKSAVREAAVSTYLARYPRSAAVAADAAVVVFVPTPGRLGTSA